MRSALSLLAALVTAVPAFTEVTYTKEVAPLLHEKCGNCHRPDQVAPMSLLTYEETRPWAKSIREQVANRSMPPWFEKGEMHRFKGDLRLTDAEIETIVAWVDANCPKGNPADMPPVPQFTDGWTLGEPDLILELDPVTIAPDVTDNVYNVPVPLSLDKDRFVTAVEIKPEPADIVHHVILFLSDDRPGRKVSPLNWLQGWAPGINQYEFPEGSGRLLKSDARMVANLHLTPHKGGGESIIKVGLHFAEEGEELLETLNHWTVNDSFLIPANDDNYYSEASFELPEDSMVYGLAPHMHLRGKDMKFTAVHPDGSEELLLDSIWNNDWQLFYQFVEPRYFDKGTKILVTGHFDNSTNNAHNPDPNRDTGWGLTIVDEMFIGYIDYVPGMRAPDSSDTD